MANLPQKSVAFIGLAFLLVFHQAGCVALNIPSRRYHDPDDHGGLFGSWRSGDLGHEWDGHALCVDEVCANTADDWADGDGSFQEAESKPPEIPWPRYHPVPTRPIFGPQIIP